jgi:transcriptional antiterminator NusG
MQRQWYAVHTYAGHENKVKTAIERRAEAMGLRDRIFRILVPTEQEMRTRQGKKVTVSRKIFPGYILIEMILDEQTWYLVKSTAGVTGFVTSGDRPVPLQEKEVEAILETVEGTQKKPRVAWQAGEQVRVVSGSFYRFFMAPFRRCYRIKRKCASSFRCSDGTRRWSSISSR